MFYKFLYITTLTTMLLGVFAGCKKLISVDTPTNQLISSTVFTNDATATSAIAGLYSSMSNNGSSFGVSGMTIFCGLYADEIIPEASQSYIDFYENSLTPANTIINSNIWVPAYNYIYQANNILEGLKKSNGVSQSLKNQLEGEALFIRSFCYFYLSNVFGDVPLILTTDVDVNTQMGRTPTEQIMSQIISDLIKAQQLLKPSYPSGSKEGLIYILQHLCWQEFIYIRKIGKMQKFNPLP